MNAFYTIIVVVQVISALTIIGLVLLQHGKGADMGAAFGSGASGSLFGATGSSNFLSKSTAIAAAVFFGATLALAFMVNKRSAVSNNGVMDALPVNAIPGNAPAKPVAAPVPAPAAATSSATPAAAVPAPAGAPAANQIPK
ncbi:MAG TPA: preprotein translocase subunit SecG [Burkholderiaceae bacterium]